MPTALKEAIKNFEAAKGVKAAETEKVRAKSSQLRSEFKREAAPPHLSTSLVFFSFAFTGTP